MCNQVGHADEQIGILKLLSELIMSK